jgi:hypothetical protein
MTAADPTGDLWEYAASFLPNDLDELARKSGALVRCRGIGDAKSLLRVLLCCALPGGSLRTASAWCSAASFATITAEGLFYRMRIAVDFLAEVLGYLVLQWRNVPCSRRVVIADASVLCGPASKGTDWRVHALYDPARAVPLEFQVHDCHKGETLMNYDLRKGDLVLGDRGYGHFRGFVSALEKGADALIRVEKSNMNLCDLEGNKIRLGSLEQHVPAAGAADFWLVWLSPDKQSCIKVRLIGIDTRSSGVCWLVTNLDSAALPNDEASDLYRMRWQIELLFKRLKSQLGLDDLRSREGPTAKAFIYAKLITAVLALRLSDHEESFSPYGYQSSQAAHQPLETLSVRPERHLRRSARRRQMDTRRPMAPQTTFKFEEEKELRSTAIA